MFNKPKFMSPSVNMYGNTVIDLNSDTIPFSCIVDGNEAVTDFRITVSRLKDNVVVFDTEMQTLEKPFYPINNRNQNVVFSIDLKKYFTTNDSSEFVNSADAYYWSITLKNSNSGTETYSASEVFYANSKPEATIYYSYDEKYNDLLEIFSKAGSEYDNQKIYFRIDENGKFIRYNYIDEINWGYDYRSLYCMDYSGLKKRKIYFKSTYNQAENVSLKRYGWRLTDTTNNFIVMDTISQNQIYGIADDISCVCNGLTNETNYQLELYIETQNGYFDVLQTINFDVNYIVKNLDAEFEVIALNNTAGIMLNWDNIRTTEGIVVGGTASYIEELPIKSSVSINIPEDTSVVFTNTSSEKDLKIDEDSYVVISFQVEKDKNMILFEMTGEDEISNVLMRRLETVVRENTTMLQYTVRKGDTIVFREKPLSLTTGELCWCIVTLYPLINNTIDFKLEESVAEGGLFPSEDIYPEDLYLYDENGNVLDGEYNAATKDYDSNLTYFKIVDNEPVEYNYNENTWDTDWSSLYCCLYPYFGKWDKLRD